MYIPRALSRVIKENSAHFRVILLTGPRQVGKTTLLREIEPSTRTYVTLDNLSMRVLAEQDPAGFLARLTLPVLIDEAQYAPSLFSYIKMVVDTQNTPGLFWLTGSQQFHMAKNISESLAGRVAVFQLHGISLAEEQGRTDLPPFLPEVAAIALRQKSVVPLTMQEIYQKIWRGGYPEMVTSDTKYWERFYESYVSTYILRDIQETLKIHNTAAFYKFMQIAAARTGQLINYADLARDIGVSEPTVKSWLAVLEASGIVYLLQPYFNNHTKRLVKNPKLYFMDTGLCAYLGGWLSPEVLERGALCGSILETFVVSEIIKSYLYQGRRPRIYFYRDKDMREIDLLIEENGVLYPIEVKKTATPHGLHFNGFDFLAKMQMPIGHGALLCFVETPTPISKTIDAVPIYYL